MRTVNYSKSEERLNIISHMLGFILSLFLFIPIIVTKAKEGESMMVLAWSIYFCAIAIMFLASSLYHSMTNPTARMIFRAIDHGVIYLTIAGSYTPIILLAVNSLFGVIIFILVWVLAIAGIIMNIIAFSIGKEEKISKASMIIYIFMGWISLFLIYDIYNKLGISYLCYLFSGGILYSLGAFFYAKKNLKYNHAIWHIFIIFATYAMFLGNFIYLT